MSVPVKADSRPAYKLGIFGDQRVAHSLSPRMHGAVLARMGLAGAYLPFEVRPDQVGAAVAGVRALGFDGVNVTVPHKTAVMDHLDSLSETARAAGAVNTIVRRGQTLMGHNTDVPGFAAALADADYAPRDRAALVVGAGGAARAAVLALVRGGAAVQVCARDELAARRLAKSLGAGAAAWRELEAAAAEAALLVNATAVSTPAEGPELAARVGALSLAKAELVMDLNYGRDINFWRALAHVRGAAFADGLGMLAHQARQSFRLWTGVDAPVELFKEALEGRS